MELDAVLEQLKGLGNDKQRAQNLRWGAPENQFGVRLGDIRKVAKEIGANRELAVALWSTGNVDARHLAILLLKPKMLSAEELDAMVRQLTFSRVSDWLLAYIAKKHPARESLREAWMTSDEPWVARAAWSLTTVFAAKNPEVLDPDGLLDRLEAEMGIAHPLAQWTMNEALVAIGVHFPERRDRATAIGEKLGLYRDYPVSKGCTSPFAPVAITAMVARAAG